MGARRIEAAVTDAGPLIHLAEINCLPPLDLFERLHVPEAVWIETVQIGSISLDEAEKYILDLQDISTLFVTPAIIDLAVQALYRHSGKA